MEVPFPGVGNSIHVSMPVTLDSGIDSAVRIESGRDARHQAMTTSTDAPSGRGADVPGDVEPQNLPP